MNTRNFLLSLTAVVGVAFGVASCQEKGEDFGPAELTVSQPAEGALTFDRTASSQEITFVATRDWTISKPSDATWIGLSSDSGAAAKGEQRVTVSVTSNDGETSASRSATLTITLGEGLKTKVISVSQEGAVAGPVVGTASGSGTEADPYNIAAVLGLFERDNIPTTQVYVKAIISEVKEIDTGSYGNATYYISDDGKTDTQFEVYRGYYLGGVKFTSADQIKVGDIVTVYGTLKLYNGTKEFDTGSKIMELNGQKATGSTTAETGTPAGTGTEADPYNVAGVRAALKGVADGETLSQIYVKGKVSKIDSTSAIYKSVYYYLSDDGKGEAESSQFYVYSGKGLNGADVTTDDLIKVGDELVVVGDAKVYKGIYEFNNKSKMVSINGQGAAVPDTPTEEITLAAANALADNTSFKTKDALVVALTTKSFIVNDGTANGYVYVAATPTVAIGDKVSFTASKTTYNGVAEYQTITDLTVQSSGSQVTYPTATDLGATCDTYTSAVPEYVTVTGTMFKDGNYTNFRVEGATKYISLANADASIYNGINEGDQVRITGYYVGTNSGKGFHTIAAVEFAKVGEAAPTLGVATEQINVAAAATSATVKVTGNVAWSASCDNAAFSLDRTSGEGAADIKVTFEANADTANAKVAHITVSTSADVATKSYTVTLTQAAAPAPGQGGMTYSYEFKSGDINAASMTATWADVAWDVAVTFPIKEYYGWDTNTTPSKGLQIGSSNNPANTIVFSTSGITGTVKSIKINTAGASQTDAKLTVKVGSTVYGTVSLTKDSTDYTFPDAGVTPTAGTISLTWELTKKAVYIKSIEIVTE